MLSGYYQAFLDAVVGSDPRMLVAYLEDRDALVDANIVMLEPDRFVEIQGTGEHDTFARQDAIDLIDLAHSGCATLFAAQRRALGW